MATLETIRESLRGAADELNPQCRCPLDIAEVLARLGISLEFKAIQGRSGRAYLVIGDSASVVVSRNRTAPSLAEGDRFSIAHEVGHWVVWRRFGFLPSSKTEYWKHEALCNEFAALLLVPPRFLAGFLRDLEQRHRVYSVFFPKCVASSARVSWDVAARSITALPSARLAYLKLSTMKCEDSLTRDDSPQEILKVVCSSFAGRAGSFLGEGARIRDNQLSDWMRGLRINERATKPLTINLGQLQLCNVGACFARQSKNCWTVQFHTDDEGITMPSGQA